MDNSTTNTQQDQSTINNTKQPEGKTYDFAHLVLYCGKCGSKYILDKDIPGNQGVKIFLPPTSTSEMRLVCKECKNEMGLFYVESDKKKDADSTETPTEVIPEVTTNEPVQEDSITEAELV